MYDETQYSQMYKRDDERENGAWLLEDNKNRTSSKQISQSTRTVESRVQDFDRPIIEH